jgi:hypothetical protein
MMAMPLVARFGFSPWMALTRSAIARGHLVGLHGSRRRASHSGSEDRARVLAAHVYAEPPNVRRGGWTWYAGSGG